MQLLKILFKSQYLGRKCYAFNHNFSRVVFCDALKVYVAY